MAVMPFFTPTTFGSQTRKWRESLYVEKDMLTPRPLAVILFSSPKPSMAIIRLLTPAPLCTRRPSVITLFSLLSRSSIKMVMDTYMRLAFFSRSVAKKAAM